MLRQRNRLRRSSDLRQVRQHGRSWRHPLAILLVHANGENVSRFSFLASRRVGKAVDRNRARRLMREAIRLHLAEIQPGWDCLLIARHNTPKAAYPDIETAVMQLLRRANLLEADS
ncbi:MAG: ribonuclease P protein component [Anaerolineae bacterium]